MRNTLKECKGLGVRYIYDPGQQVARVSGEELAEGVDGAYLVIVNEYEFAALCQKTELSHDDIVGMAQNLIVTRGENGADIYTPTSTFHIPIFDTDQIKDPTGVGDAFRSGLLKGIACEWSWDLSGKVGSLAAAYVLEHIGPQDHQFSTTEFVKRFREQFDDYGQLDAMIR